MPILIDTVRISGFRGIKNVEVKLAKNIILLGTNNSGKTSFLKSLQLSLGDYQRYLSEEDFHIDVNGVKVDEILVDIKIVPIGLDGNRVNEFEYEWVDVFSDSIQMESDGYQYVSFRTKSEIDKIKGGFLSQRYFLDEWPEFDGWQALKVSEKNRMKQRFNAIPYISIEAQRDIHNELKDKSSFIGKVLSYIEYSEGDVTALEEMVKKINDAAVDKSPPLQSLTKHLQDLNQSFLGASHAEITPFPKKIRDLSKQFSVHFGEGEDSSFSMEYHGTGTRSWASMLTVKSFLDFMKGRYEEESMPLSPVIGAEEPEAHLHPNAQRTLYKQLISTDGQIILSTHSPYLSAMADVENIRSFIKCGNKLSVNSLKNKLDSDERNALRREIMLTRGELLFSRALILCEGITEEQMIPSMFELYFNKTLFSVGVNCVSVGGKNYPPFVKLACSIGIPVYIVSDNDGKTQAEIEIQIKKLEKELSIPLDENIFSVSYLGEGNDIEAELLMVLKLRGEVIDALVLSETKGSDNSQYLQAKRRELNALSDKDILEKMRSSKASYAGFLSEVLMKNKNSKKNEELIPVAIIDSFNKIKGWLEL
ncbi:AAA family ATPase [Serratia fonticola]|uniref:ATP-dependent nuclease n=1 Tax=Serratia fonticola TaxID=47917 RepID=UPI001AE2D59F|nr:AAA family ATPase [Serratia fonticola]MBP1038706.1 AAA family ATPase [Serratia fonticola]